MRIFERLRAATYGALATKKAIYILAPCLVAETEARDHNSKFHKGLSKSQGVLHSIPRLGKYLFCTGQSGLRTR